VGGNMDCDIEELNVTVNRLTEKVDNAYEIAIADEMNNYNVSFNILFSDKFMRKYTTFNSFNEMIKKSGFKLETEEDFEKISDNELDLFIRINSSFNSWEDMIQEAVNNHFAEQLGL
jgi:hypothetical protein